MFYIHKTDVGTEYTGTEWRFGFITSFKAFWKQEKAKKKSANWLGSGSGPRKGATSEKIHLETVLDVCWNQSE